ncbi:hypothetical protein GJ744_003203 [Endocarpon pusillum]|uniref:Uncharacterized protein n=1 Tax=Endocarpon pusillum TaxID=364733 RepID=A0A8H7AVN0_9EURO|nr:hypothetical protein GJ744_003203 [Endocarpon pusillum]
MLRPRTASGTQITLYAGVNDNQETKMNAPRTLVKRKRELKEDLMEKERRGLSMGRRKAKRKHRGEGGFYLTVTQKFSGDAKIV